VARAVAGPLVVRPAPEPLGSPGAARGWPRPRVNSVPPDGFAAPPVPAGGSVCRAGARRRLGVPRHWVRSARRRRGQVGSGCGPERPECRERAERSGGTGGTGGAAGSDV